MKQLIYQAVIYMARFHDWLWALNRRMSLGFSDKQLHFLVIGVFGMLLFCVIHPLFRLLLKHDLAVAISWFYVFTFVLSVAFAIEIGQYLTRTGRMELGDVASGMQGFLTMFGAYLLIRWAVRWIRREIEKRKK